MTAYERIAESLRHRLLADEWENGQRLPTEKELCREFDVSQITVRRALQILEQERLVERRQGSGTFATSTAMRKIPILSNDFFGSIRRHAPKLERRLHSWRRTTIDRDLVATLHATPTDSVLEAIRVDELRGEPVTFDRMVIMGRCADRLEEADLADLDFLRRWQTVQAIHLEYCTQTIEAVKARSQESQLLKIRAGEPLLKETSLLFLANQQAAGLFVSYYRHDGFRFEATFDLPKMNGKGNSNG
jgi:GntR family transcriptional regulator